MNFDRTVLGIAGAITVVSVPPAVLVSSWWLVLTAFWGLNLLQSSISCPGVPA